MNSPGITVVIPTYNRVDLLGEAIDSALAQDWPEFEVVVIDDGSTDETPQLLSAYGDRVRVIHQENAGESNARNAGVSAARHELVALLDSDNRWLPGKLRRQMVLFRPTRHLNSRSPATQPSVSATARCRPRWLGGHAGRCAGAVASGSSPQHLDRPRHQGVTDVSGPVR